MDALAFLKVAWPYITAIALAGWTLFVYRDNRRKEAAVHKAETDRLTAAAAVAEAVAKNDATRLAADIAAETMKYQQQELKDARAALARNLEMELKLRRDIDKHEHEIAGLERVNEELRQRIAFLEAEIKRQAETFQTELRQQADLLRQQADRYSARIAQLEGELREQKQIVDSARRTRP